MRILYVTPVIPTETDGRRPYNFIKALGRRHEVHVIALKTPVQTMNDIVHLAKLGANAKTFNIGGLSSTVSSAFSILRGEPLRVGWCRSQRVHQAIRTFLEKRSADVIHFDRMRMGQYAIGLEGVPKLMDFTDSLALYLERSIPFRTSILDRIVDGYESSVIPRYESKVLEHVNYSLLCSTVDAERFRKDHSSAPIEVIENSVDIGEFNPKSRGTVVLPRCILSGSLFYFPNVDAVRYFVQEIWDRVRLRIRGIQTQIIGARPMNEITSLHGKNKISVVSNVKRMADYLYEDDIYVCPLRVGSGIRNKLLEAMASGMAVVTTPLGCEGLQVRSNEEVVIANDPAEFVEAIVQLVNNPDGRRAIGARARQYVETYHSTEIMIQKIEAVYEQLRAK
ncbi:MAG: glycosyltransferase family 4 protein [bacterium]